MNPHFVLFKLSKKILISALSATIFIVLLFLLDSYTTLFTKSADYAQEIDSTRVETEIKQPVVLYGMVVDDLHVIEDQVKRNQRFFDLFETVHVQPKIFQQHLKDTLQVEICQREVVTLEKSISGRIESSLSETIEEMNISHELTNKFVDIFGWQIDFQRLQKGDQFKLIYEENLVEGKSIGIERVLAIYFEHFGRGEYAFPFDQGEGLDYFDEEGNSLRKALLKYPIEFTRISSRYNLNRFHPVAKVFRAHLGTDFAAPTGTPIRSVGDGNVEEARYTANNGNYVKIRHNSTYTTGYLHMSKIATGIVAGSRVRQGQTIGYVGSTGLATGPHLCFRFWRNGVQIDALRVELPPSQPVQKEHVARFSEVKETFSKRLQLISFPQPAASEVIVARN
jgi:murein DD-endopeptidase MepM/ murein hydrolase activator NlpD